MNNKILEGLTQAQKEAVTWTDGPLLVLAGAGSGKTRVITRRIAYLLNMGVKPYEIMAVTFTNKAADEMAERISQLLGSNVKLPYLGTFHSVCLKILRFHSELLGYEKDFTVFDESKSRELLKNIAKSIGYTHKEEVTAFVGKAKRYIEGFKNKGVFEPPQPQDSKEGYLYRAAQLYQQRLKENNAMDFGDLLINTLKLLSEFPEVRKIYKKRIRYVMVDEFQDTNPVQYQIVRLISEDHRNLCVVGDDDQSIYSWRGATIENILQFDKDFEDAKVVYLLDNYRSKGKILKAATAIVSRNSLRHKKELRPTKDDGYPVLVHISRDPNDEAEFIADTIQILSRGTRYEDIAVFFRTNAQSRPIEEVFVRRRIPYRLVGSVKFFQRKEIKDVLSFLELVANPKDAVALTRVINVPPRGIGPKSVEALFTLSAQEGKGVFEVIDKSRLPKAKKESLNQFAAWVYDLHDRMSNMQVDEIIQEVLVKSGYLAFLESNPKEKDRVANVKELVLDAKEFVLKRQQEDESATLVDYLSGVNLRMGENVEGQGGVNLMTVHAAKGLEFNVVFVAGLVEGLFPHHNSLLDNTKLEEERRLMYVAMTRAKERLILSTFERRMVYGQGWSNAKASRFLTEVPNNLIRPI